MLPTASPPDPRAGGDPLPPADGSAPDAPSGPSGWHADPWRRHQSRFFDGHLWTEHVADGGICSVDSTPVAELPRSRPAPARDAPRQDLLGPRVIDAPGSGGRPPSEADLDRDVLLLDQRPDPDGVRRLRLPDDTEVGRITAAGPSLVTRLGRGLVAAPVERATGIDVHDWSGAPRVRLSRPAARTAPEVDVHGLAGPLGSVVAVRLLQGLRARVLDAAGTQVGALEELDDPAWLQVLGADGGVRARVTPVWDVPGARHHLPPGVLLVDRRTHGGPPPAPAEAALLLGAVLAPALLRPPPPPTDR